MLPVKLMEYVSLGVPAVVPRLRTIQHYFTPDMVGFFEPEDVESMAEAIWALHESPARRCEQARRARAFLDEFGWDRQGPELVAFYRQLLES
jgi:glycosyltransferase involved in cell wall biosynthesis